MSDMIYFVCIAIFYVQLCNCSANLTFTLLLLMECAISEDWPSGLAYTDMQPLTLYWPVF